MILAIYLIGFSIAAFINVIDPKINKSTPKKNDILKTVFWPVYVIVKFIKGE